MKVFQREINKSNSPVSQDTAALIMDVVPLLMNYIRTEMRSRMMPGLTLPQFRSLIYIYRHKNTSLSQLANHIGVKLPTMSKIIETLVMRKLVIRREYSQDRRRITLKLSTEGAEELRQARHSAETRFSEILSVLTPEQQSEIGTSLDTLRSLFGNIYKPKNPVENTGDNSGGSNG